MSLMFAAPDPKAVPIRFVTAESWPRVQPLLSSNALAFAAAGVALARDLINTPANEMGPDALEAAVAALAGRYEAGINIVRGNDLLTQNFPLIHAVGRAAKQAPRLVEFVWGQASAPKITLV